MIVNYRPSPCGFRPDRDVQRERSLLFENHPFVIAVNSSLMEDISSANRSNWKDAGGQPQFNDLFNNNGTNR